MPALAERKVRRTAPRVVRSPAVPAAPATRRVLVADPCRDTVESTAWLLRMWGHDVRQAASGPEALAVARAYRPDTVLMEIRLPGLDGCEVARRLRRPGARPGLLVAVTGSGDEKNRRGSREAGFDLHLLKPVDPEVLRGLLAASHRDGEGSK